MKETEIMREAIELFRMHGILAWRNHTQAVIRGGGNQPLIFAKNQNAGSPDIFAVTKSGRLAGIEVKTPKGRLTESQVTWLNNLRSRHCITAVIRSIGEAFDMLPWLTEERPYATYRHPAFDHPGGNRRLALRASARSNLGDRTA